MKKRMLALILSFLCTFSGVGCSMGNTTIAAETPATSVAAVVETTAPAAPAEKLISASDAKSIALDHAGLSESDVTGLRAQYDVDDGVREFEVEFRSGAYKYDYTIHAVTGKIISWDKEYDD